MIDFDFDIQLDEYEVKLALSVLYYDLPAGKDENPNYGECDFDVKYKILSIEDTENDLLMRGNEVLSMFKEQYHNKIDALLHEDYADEIIKIHNDYVNDIITDRLIERYE